MRFRNFLAVAAVLPVLAPGTTNAAEIIPHQAIYRLNLKALNVDGWADSSSGVMDVSVSRDCFHFGYDRRLEFDIVYTDERVTHLVIEDRLRESVGGRHFWFWSRTTLNGRTVGIIAGEANRPEAGSVVEVKEEVVEMAKVEDETDKDAQGSEETQEAVAEKAAAEEAAREAEEKTKKQKEVRFLGVNVRYDWPEEQQIEVPQNVIFPFGALRQQLDRLAKGELAPELPVFDGSSSEGAFRAIYRPAPMTEVAKRPVPDGDAELLNTPAWRYTTQYVLIDGDDPRPARTETSKVHKNGIVSETIIDFGLFTVEGSLAWVKGLELPSCN
ncbi:MAG: DUF1849 family protein [Rhodospirillales bacterium]|nr:MAG: DUF1849 family protein [Rhodospirillales bacterium]